MIDNAVGVKATYLLSSTRIATPLVVALACAITCGAGSRQTAGQASTTAAGVQQDAFPVFDALGFLNRPLRVQLGLDPIYLVINGFWRGRAPYFDRREPDEAACRNTARFAMRSGAPLVIDVEHWPIDIRYVSELEAIEGLRKLGQIADWIHDEAPSVKLGFYSMAPIRDYWTPVLLAQARRMPDGPARDARLKKTQQEYDRWIAANEFVREHLGGKIDYVFPSLYTFYDDPLGWQDYARANIEAARQFGKPVYPFLWMEYHESNPKLAGRTLPANEWRAQLEACREFADGVVIWGGHARKWDGRAPWWVETRNFLRERKSPTTTAATRPVH